LAKDLREFAWGVAYIDLIVIVGGGLGSRHFGPGMWIAGAGLAAYVTCCFGLVVGANVAIQAVVDWHSARKRRRETRRRGRVIGIGWRRHLHR